MPTGINIDWDDQAPATAKSSGPFTDQRAREYLRTESLRVEMVSLELWRAAGPHVFFVGVFDVMNGIHVLRPLNPRTVHDGKFNQDCEQRPMDRIVLRDLINGFPP